MDSISKALSYFCGPRAVPSTESCSTLETDFVTGTHHFTIAQYSKIKSFSCGCCLESAIFTIGGHEWYILFYPNGIIPRYEGHVSISVCRKTLGSEVKAHFTVTIIDSDGNPSKMTHTSEFLDFPKHDPRDNIGNVPLFVQKRHLEKSKYVKNDSCTIRCTITVLTRSHVESRKSPITVPPSNIVQHLGNLLDSGNGSDVTFMVGGQKFPAHKWLLAERSPVFRAELFGPMMENSMKIIKLDDIEAPVFKMLLHFIYTDLVPEFMDYQNNCQSMAAIAQHLLVASDRYGVERLKLMCEEKLSLHVDVANVVMLLVLAEQHNCLQLKATCLAFMASPKVLAGLMSSDGVEYLKKNYPSVIQELQDLIGSVS